MSSVVALVVDEYVIALRAVCFVGIDIPVFLATVLHLQIDSMTGWCPWDTTDDQFNVTVVPQGQDADPAPLLLLASAALGAASPTQ